MKGFLLAGLAVFALAGCASKTAAVTNSNGSPTNAAETVAGDAYVGYIAADAAWLAALKSGKVPAATVNAVEPKRKAAREALDAFATASVQGDAAALQSAYASSEAAFVSALAGAGIAVKSN